MLCMKQCAAADPTMAALRADLQGRHRGLPCSRAMRSCLLRALHQRLAGAAVQLPRLPVRGSCNGRQTCVAHAADCVTLRGTFAGRARQLECLAHGPTLRKR